jgi:hypothetical protein
MNDDDLTSLHELASSHVDGDNSPEARAHVAATAELQAMVDAFRAVRTTLTTVVPAPVAAREAALAAALAAFDEHHSAAAGGDTAPPAAAPVISLASRRRWPSKVMGIAAAVAAVGVIGVGATQLGGGNDKSSSTESAEKAQMDSVSGGDEVQIESVPALAPSVTIGSINSAGSVATVINTPAELAALPALTMLADPAAAPADTAAENDMQRMISSNSAAVACLSDTQVYLADIFYNGAFGIAARDTVTGVTSAITDDCTVLVSVAP